MHKVSIDIITTKELASSGLKVAWAKIPYASTIHNSSHNKLLIVAKIGKQMVGFAELDYFPCYKTINLCNVSTHLEYQNKGIASTIIAHLPECYHTLRKIHTEADNTLYRSTATDNGRAYIQARIDRALDHASINWTQNSRINWTQNSRTVTELNRA